METIKAKRTGEITLQEQTSNSRSVYKEVLVDFEVKGKKATMIIKDGWDEPKLVNWHFITGDHLIDSTAKIMPDFSAFCVLDYEVDISEILSDAKEFFNALKEEEKKKIEEKRKIERAKEYDTNYFVTALKPALETKGHTVKIHPATKEEYINSCFNISLIIGDNNLFIEKDYRGWLQVNNNKYGDSRIVKTTRSTRLEKWISLIEETIEADKYRIKTMKEEAKRLAGTKERLENVLGIEVMEKSEYHSSYNHRGQGYYTPYFCKKSEREYKEIKFVESSTTIDGVSVKGFVMSNLPIITDMEKLKKIYDLLVS